MPKIYEYNGFSFSFYSNDHEPPHCHVSKGGKKMKIGFEYEEDGSINSYAEAVRHKFTFNSNELKDIQKFVAKYHAGIISKWNKFFYEKGEPECEKIAKL